MIMRQVFCKEMLSESSHVVWWRGIQGNCHTVVNCSFCSCVSVLG